MSQLSIRIAGVSFLLLVHMHSAQAERVYQFINYPAIQNGYTLSGSITTSDDAPADGSLALEEIIDWQYSIVGEWSVSASFGPPPPPGFPLTSLRNVAISMLAIELPAVMEPASEFLSRLELTDILNPGRAQTVPSLIYQSSSDPRTGETIFQSSASMIFEGDGLVPMWSNQVRFGNSSLIIAAYVPEPSTMMLVIVGGIVWTMFRSGKSCPMP